MAHFAQFAVLLAIQPLLCALHGFKLKHNDALRFPIAFKHFSSTAADDVFAAVLLDGRACEFLVFLVTGRIQNVDFNDHICRHLRK